MPGSFRWAAAFVLPVALLTASCDTIGGVTVPGSIQSTLVSAQPAAVAPQFFADPFCPSAPPFVAVVGITVTSATDLFLQRIQFELVDRFGGRSVPAVTPIPIPEIHTTTPVSTPVPIPGFQPIPNPGQVSFGGHQMLSGQSRTDSFSLRFDCGVPAAGTLFFTVESTNRQGTSNVSRASVRIGV
jgi:hypothetical protein